MIKRLVKKSWCFTIILLFVGAAVVPNVISSNPKFSTSGQDDVLLVPEEFSSIQEAVDYAHANRPTLYEINVSDNNLSSYRENINIEYFYNGLILTRRNNSHNPVIDAEEKESCIKIENSDEVDVSGFTLINCGSEENDAGIYFRKSTDCSASLGSSEPSTSLGSSDSSTSRTGFSLDTADGVILWKNRYPIIKLNIPRIIVMLNVTKDPNHTIGLIIRSDEGTSNTTSWIHIGTAKANGSESNIRSIIEIIISEVYLRIRRIVLSTTLFALDTGIAPYTEPTC